MERRYFGTDGIRGTANRFPMTPDVALKVGMAAGLEFCNRGKHRHRVVIAKDTRLSGYMIESALMSGFISVGMDVTLAGPLPTPAVAMLTRSLRADLGVMISASHNAYEDNGIKLFGPDGYKLSDDIELSIESRLHEVSLEGQLAAPDKLGKALRMEDARGRYIEYAKHTFPRGKRLDGMKIVLDCANGAGYHVAPIVLWELGADVVPMGNKPDGFNINEGCGSTAPDAMCQAVRAHRADIGIALDGDADRLVMCDEKGDILDGDQLMALIATYWQRREWLRGGCIVATQMSNLGMERYLNDIGLQLRRARVGDRYVMEMMREVDCNLGGEQSGHIILSDYSTTGDGLIAALQVLAVLQESGRPASETGRVFTALPQILKNVRYEGVSPLEKAEVKQAIAEGEARLDGHGRLFIRKSGTEPLIRVMAEGEDESLVRQVVGDVAAAVQQAG